MADNSSYETILITGGAPAHNPNIESWMENSEAGHFLNVFQSKSRAKPAVLVETEAMNTGQNAILSYESLKNKNLVDVKNVLLVTNRIWKDGPW